MASLEALPLEILTLIIEYSGVPLMMSQVSRRMRQAAMMSHVHLDFTTGTAGARHSHMATPKPKKRLNKDSLEKATRCLEAWKGATWEVSWPFKVLDFLGGVVVCLFVCLFVSLFVSLFGFFIILSLFIRNTPT